MSARFPRRPCLAGAALLFTVSGCEIEKVGIPPTASIIAMHGVLSASASTQVVLLERTRNGTVSLFEPHFDLGDPVVSDAGVAETGAIMRLTTPDGQTLLAREDNTVRDDQKGQGMYRFALPGSALERSGTFRLSVQTATGEVLTAETSVPAGAAAAAATQRLFDRAEDTLVLEWPAAPGARSYFVRIETPFGPRSFFTDSTRVRLTGELRNIDARALPRVFIPGFPQAITVSAVDSNYYDWYRTHNNRLSGTGLVNRVEGGIGLFGSLVRLRFEELSVVAPQTEQVAGTFPFEGTPLDRSVTPYLNLEIYVESRAARTDQSDALSGRYVRRGFLGMTGCVVCGLLGTVKNGEIELAFLRAWSATDTVEVFNGEIRGDTIVGKYRGLGLTARFVKQR
jgi:hypothetical protein